MKRIVFLSLFALAMMSTIAQPPRPHPHRPCATREQMSMVMTTLEKQSFDDQKLEVAELCVAIGTFCVNDLERMARVFSFDDKRLEFLQFAYAYCTDPENYPMMRDVFTFSANYDKLIDYIYPKKPRR